MSSFCPSKPSSLPNTMTTINQSELTSIIRDIFRGVVSPFLENTFNEVYRGNINYTFHSQLVDQIDAQVKYEMRDMALSLITIRNRPVVDIIVRVVKRAGSDTQYYIVGSDLRKYHMYLPKIHDKKTGCSIRPRTGTNHSKWYPFFLEKTMKNIALHLRMLDLFLKNNRIRITRDYTTAETGILGAEVHFDIPERFRDMFVVDDLEKDSNPTKIANGLYVYGKNGVNKESSAQIATTIASLTEFTHVFPKQVTTPEELVEFIKAPQTIAMGSWNRHARVLIKHCAVKTVDILDPWKRTIESETLTRFRTLASSCDWSVNFVVRSIVDQVRGEGSCVLVAFARLLFLASCGASINSFMYNLQIPEFYAFFSSYFYRKTL